MDATDLARFIKQNQIAAEIVHLPMKTPTVADAAEALGVRPQQIVKSLLFLAAGEPVLVVTNGVTRVQRKRLADVVGMSRRRVKIASAEQVAVIAGYVVGAVPPFGHPSKLRTLLDVGVLEETAVYGGGGDINALAHITTLELKRVTTAEVVAIADR